MPINYCTCGDETQYLAGFITEKTGQILQQKKKKDFAVKAYYTAKRITDTVANLSCTD